MINNTYDDIDPSIVYLADSPLRGEFEELHCELHGFKPYRHKINKERYLHWHDIWRWHGYHDRALQENMKLRDAPVMRELSDEEIFDIAYKAADPCNSYQDIRRITREESEVAETVLQICSAILSAAKGNK